MVRIRLGLGTMARVGLSCVDTLLTADVMKPQSATVPVIGGDPVWAGQGLDL